MKAKSLSYAALALLSLGASAAEDERLAASRAMSQQFARELMQALTSAMQSGGPSRAIVVCQEQAPQIAQRLSEEHGAVISRTSLKVRRASNAPSSWQRDVLELFEQQHAAGKDVATLEHFEATPGGGAHYMKAIPTQPLCVACHGREIAPEVRRALAERYPADAATGFEVGDLRGAFSIVWPDP